MPVTILPPSGFVTTPWKNGGGITHEIIRDAATPWRWRISLAEVASDGPFSAFDGMARVLTVITGAGLDFLTPEGVLHARPLEPLAFSGGMAVDGRLVDGPVRDLNLIYDPRMVQAEVAVRRGPWQGAVVGGVYALAGKVTLSGALVPPGAMGWGEGECMLDDQALAVVFGVRAVGSGASTAPTPAL